MPSHRTQGALPNVPLSGSGEVVTALALRTLRRPNHKLESTGLLLRMVDGTRMVTLNYKMPKFEGCPFGRALKSPVRRDIELRGKVCLN